MSLAGAEKLLDHSKVNPLNLAARRDHIEKFFRHLNLRGIESVHDIRPRSEQQICELLDERGWHNINHHFFEYEVDSNIWDSLLGYVGLLEANPWPWSQFPDMKDLSDGVSPVYREWRVRQGKPVNEPVENSTIAQQFPVPEDSKPAGRPSVPSAAALKHPPTSVASPERKRHKGPGRPMRDPARKVMKSAVGRNVVANRSATKKGAKIHHNSFTQRTEEKAKGGRGSHGSETGVMEAVKDEPMEEEAMIKEEPSEDYI